MKKFNLTNERTQRNLAPFISIFLGFVVGFILLLLLGFNPVEGYSFLFHGGVRGVLSGDFRQLGNVLLNTTPLILTGLAIAFAFRTGLFNIGVTGQMLMGGFFGILVGAMIELPRIIHVPLMILASITGGALWAFVPGVLKAKFRINEVVTGIMMNYIALWGVQYYVGSWIPGRFPTESAMIHHTASLRVNWMTQLFNGSAVNIGLILAILACYLIWLILEKTTFGYELKAVGFNQDAAQYAGMKVKKNIMLSMFISGALAGLAGATFYAGFTNHVLVGELPSQGFDGIAVALLGLNTPIGIFLSALLLGFMNIGGQYMQTMARIPKELVDIIISTIIYFAALTLLIQSFFKQLNSNNKKRNGGGK